MFAYLLTLLGVLSHAIPHPGLPLTAVGGSLLYFGARRPLWQAIFPVAALAASDYYLTTHVYSFPFVVQGYLLTWAWYAAVIVLGAILLTQHHYRRPRRLRRRLRLPRSSLPATTPSGSDSRQCIPQPRRAYHLLCCSASLLWLRPGFHRHRRRRSPSEFPRP